MWWSLRQAYRVRTTTTDGAIGALGVELAWAAIDAAVAVLGAALCVVTELPHPASASASVPSISAGLMSINGLSYC